MKYKLFNPCSNGIQKYSKEEALKQAVKGS